MKKILVLVFIAIGFISKAQNYADSMITLNITRLSAIYIAKYVEDNKGDVWKNRTSPSTFQPYVGAGDSLNNIYTVKLKAGFILGLIDKLLTGHNQAVQADRLSIINNSPSIPGYTALTTQIVSKANGNTSEKNVAAEIANYYNNKVAQLDAEKLSMIAEIVQWTQLQ